MTVTGATRARRRFISSRIATTGVVVASLVTATATSGTAGSEGRGTKLRVPPEVARHADDWPLPGRDYANTRARPDARIRANSVDRLELAWSVPLPGASAFGNAATTPLVIGDTVYVQDLQSNVRAVDLETGAVRWTYDSGRFQIGPNGVAVGYGNVFVADGSRDIAALDADTGEKLWTTRITATETEGVDIQPIVVHGLVLAATVPISIAGQYRGGDRGVLWALDARTGRKVWSFDTVKSRDLWGNPDVNSGGGAWYPPAIDVSRGLVYWGIANPAPFPGTAEFPNGTSRPGRNLYTESVVALHVRTGKLAWFHQAFPHDLFDRDLMLTAIARVADADGAPRDVVIGTGKGGRVLALDADDGSRTTDTPVGEHRNDDLAELAGPTEVLPGLFGGVLTPLAVADGTVYVAVVNAPSTHRPDDENFFGGAALGTMQGDVAAVDARTGDVLWSTKVDGDPLGGTTVVGDLVFTATYQGTLLALDRANGAVVWSVAAPGGVNGQPAVTADTIVWPIGIADPPALVAYRLR